MQRTLQPYSFLPTDVRNTNPRFMDISGASTLNQGEIPLVVFCSGENDNLQQPARVHRFRVSEG